MSKIRINRVYTRSGDGGDTALSDGTRVSKCHPRVEAYGNVDELNSVLGLARAKLTTETEELAPLIENLQQELFDLGSQLSNPTSENKVYAERVKTLETMCDKYNDELPELTSFVLPGGSELAALLHLARTLCRRCERSVIAIGQEEGSEGAVQYLNRLSDLLFVLARWSLKQEGRSEVLWKC